jgi:AP endonuclease-2
MAGDINISRDGMDTSHMEIAMRQNNMTAEQYISAPSRRLFNQLMEGGTVYGERDEWRAYPVLWDICRGFHPSRMGLFTCWEQKVNARPANFGSRIDYVLCSLDIKEWFSDSNIQEGLQVCKPLSSKYYVANRRLGV